MKPVDISYLFTIKHVGRKALPHFQYRENEKRPLITKENMNEILDGPGFKGKDSIVFAGVALDGVDLKDCEKPVSLISCISINSRLPERSLIEASTLVNTDTQGNSLFINSHLEGGIAGRCDSGPNSYFKDCSIYNGMAVNKGSVVLSTLAAGTLNSHIESGVTIYGGCHVKNTYDKNVDVLYVNANEVKGAYQMFLDRNNANSSFSQALSLDDVYTHADKLAASSIKDNCLIVYPHDITTDDYLVNKTADDISAAEFIKGRYRGKERDHRDLSRTLIHDYRANKIKNYKPDINGTDNVKKLVTLIERHAEITDVAQQVYRRNNSVQMLGVSQEALQAFEVDYLQQLYWLHSDNEADANKAVDSIVESADQHLQTGIDRGTAHRMLSTSIDQIINLSSERDVELAPAPS
jgi:hypothetical protein